MGMGMGVVVVVVVVVVVGVVGVRRGKRIQQVRTGSGSYQPTFQPNVVNMV